MGVDILALWHHAGPFAKGIVITLLIMSFFSLTIALNKLWQIHKSAAATRKFASHFSRSIQEEQLDQAIALAEKNQGSHRSEERRVGKECEGGGVGDREA